MFNWSSVKCINFLYFPASLIVNVWKCESNYMNTPDFSLNLTTSFQIHCLKSASSIKIRMILFSNCSSEHQCGSRH